MKERLLSINIDMGMSYNGIFYADLERNSTEGIYIINDKSATCVSIKEDAINYSKSSRRNKRHIERNYQREKLAKRLFDEIIKIENYNRKQQEQLHGLLKNRGFTYLTITDEFEPACDIVIDFINEKAGENKDYILNGLYCKEDIEKSMVKYSNKEDLSNYIDNLINEIDIINKEPIKDKDIKKYLNKYLKDLKKLLQKQKEEIELELGQKPRTTYFKDIKDIISDDINFVNNFSKDELYNIICNISNLQLRCLRKYFNKKYDNIFNNELLAEKIYKFYISHHYKDKKEKDTKNKLNPFLNKLKENKNALEFLKTVNPIYTIPPMEDMNNRGGYKCNVLLIKDELLDENIKKCLEILYSTENFIDHNGQVIENINYFLNDRNNKIDYEKAFRRFADYSLNMIDTTKTTPVEAGFISSSSHPRKIFASAEIYDDYFKAHYFRDNETEYEKFKELLIKYYKEEKNILNGIYTETKSIFKPCNCNTPHKNKVKHILINSLIRFNGDGFNENDVIKFEEKIRAEKYKGNSKIYGYLKKVSDVAKKDKNSFFHNAVYYYNHNNEKNEPYDNIVDNLEIVMQKIANILFDMGKINENEKKELSNIDNEKSFKNKLNITKQLYDILDKDISGFYKTCKNHTAENECRSQVINKVGHAVYKRLLSRVAKQVDGEVDMHLDRLAYEIVENIPFDISKFNKLEINIEENRFEYEEGLSVVKNKQPKKHKQDDRNKKPICPYTDKEIVNGDYDHIIPRSSSFGIFNSEANLIYCSSEGNQAIKGKNIYNLSDIKKGHLKQVFNTDNYDEIIKYITKHLYEIDKNKYTNFSNLNKQQQKAFRYALFLQYENHELFNYALELLRQDKLKTTTNGTQKRLISLIYEKSLLKNNNLECTANVVTSSLVRATRNELATQDDKLKKLEKQNNHSHCIDASIVFYLSHSSAKEKSIQSKLVNNLSINKKDYDYFTDIYLSESFIARIEKKRKFITLDKTKHDMDSIKYFDDTIYSIYIEPYRNIDKEVEKELNILLKYELLYKKIKNKKFFITKLEDINKNNVLWVSKEKYFDLLFNLFHDKKIQELKELDFMDKRISSKVKQDVKSIFFKDGDIKKDFIIDEDNKKDIPKVTYELYKRLKNEFQHISLDEREEVYKKVCKKFYYPVPEYKDENGKKRGSIERERRTKRDYSITLKAKKGSGANYIIRRKNNDKSYIYQAVRNKNIVPITVVYDEKVITIQYYSKNTIPISISSLLNILIYKDITEKIYELKIINIDNVAKKYIKEITYFLDTDKRTTVHVTLIKKSFSDIDFNIITEFDKNNMEFKKMLDAYFNNKLHPLNKYLGSMRDGKAILLEDSIDFFKLKFVRNCKGSKVILENI